MMKPLMLASWALTVVFFHGWAFALFWGWNAYRCGALFATSFVWCIAAVVLTVMWTDRQNTLRQKREKDESERLWAANQEAKRR